MRRSCGESKSYTLISYRRTMSVSFGSRLFASRFDDDGMDEWTRVPEIASAKADGDKTNSD